MKNATRIVLPLIVLLALVRLSAPTAAKASVGEQPAGSLSIETLMATPFPTDLVAAPTGGRIAWVSSNSGVHNILVTDLTPLTTGPLAGRIDPNWRAATTYQGDDGLWITDLNWASDGKTIVYVRGDGANRQGENPNPAQLTIGAMNGSPGSTEQPLSDLDVWIRRRFAPATAQMTCPYQKLQRHRGGAAEGASAESAIVIVNPNARGTPSLCTTAALRARTRPNYG